MSRITLSTPWRELPPGWKWAFRLGGGLALCLPLLAFAHLQAHSPFAPAWEDWFTFGDVLRLLGRGLPWAGAVALVAISGRRRLLCLWTLVVMAAIGSSLLLVETGRFQPLLWKGRRVPVRRMVLTHCVPDYDDARPAVLRTPQDLEVWRKSIETENDPPPPLPDLDFSSEMGAVFDLSYRCLDHVELREFGGILHVLAAQKVRWVPSGISINLTYERAPIAVVVMGRTAAPIELEEVRVRGFGGDFLDWLARFLCDWKMPSPIGTAERLR